MKNFNSLKKNKDFKKVYNKKNVVSDNLMILFIDKNEEMESNRIGISVSRKVGNSVIRHTLVRRLREIWRKEEQNLEKYYDMIFVCREKAKDVDFVTLRQSFVKLCKRQFIYKEENL